METTQTQKGRNWGDVRRVSQHTGLGIDFLNLDRITRRVGIPYVKVGRRCLYDLDEVDRFLASRMTRPDNDSK